MFITSLSFIGRKAYRRLKTLTVNRFVVNFHFAAKYCLKYAHANGQESSLRVNEGAEWKPEIHSNLSFYIRDR